MNILPKKFVNKFIINEQKQKSARWLELNGCSKNIDASYDGYTGIKLHRFPTSEDSFYACYPDITKDYEKLKFDMICETSAVMKKTFGKIRVLKLFLDNFATGAKWDTKFMVEFPGRDRQGKVQFARYNGKIVTGNYISNNVYGYLCAAIGIPERMSKFIARVYSKGFLEPIISGKIPDKKLLKFSDPISDQEAVSSGYRDFRNQKLHQINNN